MVLIMLPQLKYSGTSGKLFSPSGNTEHNLETSGISRSEHFRITASLLGVSALHSLPFCVAAKLLFGDFSVLVFSLQVRKSSLAASLTHRSFLTIRDSVVKPLSVQEASSSRDALVKVEQPSC